VASSGIAPQPYALFQEWEHWFLVEEFIEGVSMSTSYASVNSILLRTRPSSEDVDGWYQSFRSLFQGVVQIIDI